MSVMYLGWVSEAQLIHHFSESRRLTRRLPINHCSGILAVWVTLKG
jgi:hypothetical protein